MGNILDKLATMRYSKIDIYNPFPLKRGDKDANGSIIVKSVQSHLGLKKDGLFGKNTEDALKKKHGVYQVSKELFSLISSENPDQPLTSESKKRRLIVIHATDTPEGRFVTKKDIDLWHQGAKKLSDGRYRFQGRIYPAQAQLPSTFLHGIPIDKTVGNGWSKSGYERVINPDGCSEIITPQNDDHFVDPWEISFGASGVNEVALHVAYAGGRSKDMKEYKNTMTKAQENELIRFLQTEIKEDPDVEIAGHNELPNVTKKCPCFSVYKWLKENGFSSHNIYLSY